MMQCYHLQLLFSTHWLPCVNQLLACSELFQIMLSGCLILYIMAHSAAHHRSWAFIIARVTHRNLPLRHHLFIYASGLTAFNLDLIASHPQLKYSVARFPDFISQVTFRPLQHQNLSACALLGDKPSIKCSLKKLSI